MEHVMMQHAEFGIMFPPLVLPEELPPAEAAGGPRPPLTAATTPVETLCDKPCGTMPRVDDDDDDDDGPPMPQLIMFHRGEHDEGDDVDEADEASKRLSQPTTSPITSPVVYAPSPAVHVIARQSTREYASLTVAQQALGPNVFGTAGGTATTSLAAIAEEAQGGRPPQAPKLQLPKRHYYFGSNEPQPSPPAALPPPTQSPQPQPPPPRLTSSSPPMDPDVVLFRRKADDISGEKQGGGGGGGLCLHWLSNLLCLRFAEDAVEYEFLVYFLTNRGLPTSYGIMLCVVSAIAQLLYADVSLPIFARVANVVVTILWVFLTAGVYVLMRRYHRLENAEDDDDVKAEASGGMEGDDDTPRDADKEEPPKDTHDDTASTLVFSDHVVLNNRPPSFRRHPSQKAATSGNPLIAPAAALLTAQASGSVADEPLIVQLPHTAAVLSPILTSSPAPHPPVFHVVAEQQALLLSSQPPQHQQQQPADRMELPSAACSTSNQQHQNSAVSLASEQAAQLLHNFAEAWQVQWKRLSEGASSSQQNPSRSALPPSRSQGSENTTFSTRLLLSSLPIFQATEQPRREKFRTNAKFQERLACTYLIATYCFGAVNFSGKGSCNDPRWTEEDAYRVCRFAIQVDAILILMLVFLTAMVPIRLHVYTPFSFGFAILYFAYKFIPSINIDVIPTSYWIIVAVFGAEIVMCACYVRRYEASCRTWFQLHLKRCVRTLEAAKVRQQSERVLSTKAPVAVLRRLMAAPPPAALIGANGKFGVPSGVAGGATDSLWGWSENAVYAELRLGGFQEYAWHRGPSEIVALLQRMTDALDALRTRTAWLQALLAQKEEAANGGGDEAAKLVTASAAGDEVVLNAVQPPPPPVTVDGSLAMVRVQSFGDQYAVLLLPPTSCVTRYAHNGGRGGVGGVNAVAGSSVGSRSRAHSSSHVYSTNNNNHGDTSCQATAAPSGNTGSVGLVTSSFECDDAADGGGPLHAPGHRSSTTTTEATDSIPPMYTVTQNTLRSNPTVAAGGNAIEAAGASSASASKRNLSHSNTPHGFDPTTSASATLLTTHTMVQQALKDVASFVSLSHLLLVELLRPISSIVHGVGADPSSSAALVLDSAVSIGPGGGTFYRETKGVVATGPVVEDVRNMFQCRQRAKRSTWVGGGMGTTATPAAVRTATPSSHRPLPSNPHASPHEGPSQPQHHWVLPVGESLFSEWTALLLFGGLSSAPPPLPPHDTAVATGTTYNPSASLNTSQHTSLNRSPSARRSSVALMSTTAVITTPPVAPFAGPSTAAVVLIPEALLRRLPSCAQLESANTAAATLNSDEKQQQGRYPTQFPTGHLLQDGCNACRRIRRQPLTCKLDIIAMPSTIPLSIVTTSAAPGGEQQPAPGGAQQQPSVMTPSNNNLQEIVHISSSEGGGQEPMQPVMTTSATHRARRRVTARGSTVAYHHGGGVLGNGNGTEAASQFNSSSHSSTTWISEHASSNAMAAAAAMSAGGLNRTVGNSTTTTNNNNRAHAVQNAAKRSELQWLRPWLPVRVFADVKTESEYRSHRSTAGTATDWGWSHFGNLMSLIALSVALCLNDEGSISSSGDTALSRRPMVWVTVALCLGVFGLALTRVMHTAEPTNGASVAVSSSPSHEAGSARLVRAVHVPISLGVFACYVAAIGVASLKHMVQDSQLIWLFVVAHWSLQRPLWAPWYVLWLVGDASVGILNFFRSYVMFDIVSAAKTFSQYLSLLHLLYSLVYRLVLESAQREAFALRKQLEFLEEELTSDFVALEKALEAMIPHGIAGRLVTRAKRRLAGGGRQRLHPAWSTSFCTATEETPFLLVQLRGPPHSNGGSARGAAANQNSSGSQSHRRDTVVMGASCSCRLGGQMGCDACDPDCPFLAARRQSVSGQPSPPGCDAEAYAAMSARIQSVLEAASGATSNFRDAVQTVKADYDTVMFVATKLADDKDDFDEVRADWMMTFAVHLAEGVLSSSSSSAGRERANADFRILVGSGPLMGAVVGSSSALAFEYFGSWAIRGMRVLELLEWGSVAATERSYELHRLLVSRDSSEAQSEMPRLPSVSIRSRDSGFGKVQLVFLSALTTM